MSFEMVIRFLKTDQHIGLLPCRVSDEACGGHLETDQYVV
jgi:hypothetical protein